MITPHWYAWLLVGIAVIILLPYSRIVWTDVRKMKTISQGEPKNKYLKRLRYISMVAMLCCGLFYIVAIVMVLHCNPTTATLTNTCYYYIKIFITFYQLSRLQYCFSSEQVHSTKYGYSKSAFNCLYLMGIVLCGLTFASFVQALARKDNQLLDINYTCAFSSDDMIGVWMLIPGLVFFGAWDWTIILLYVRKCYQFRDKNRFNSDENMDNHVFLRIKFILSKILLLTILLEIYALLAIVGYQMMFIVQAEELAFINSLFFVFDGLVSTYLISMMLSHNDDKYMRFIEFMNGLRVCCCFKWFINVALTYSAANDMEFKVVEREMIKQMTITDHEEMPQQIQAKMSTMSHI